MGTVINYLLALLCCCYTICTHWPANPLCQLLHVHIQYYEPEFCKHRRSHCSLLPLVVSNSNCLAFVTLVAACRLWSVLCRSRWRRRSTYPPTPPDTPCKHLFESNSVIWRQTDVAFDFWPASLFICRLVVRLRTYVTCLLLIRCHFVGLLCFGCVCTQNACQ